MPKIAKKDVEVLEMALKLAVAEASTAVRQASAENYSKAWKACKSFTNKYEGRVMKLKRPKPKATKRKPTTK